LQKHYPSVKPILVCSGQHEELLVGLDRLFGIGVDNFLDIRKAIGPTDNLPLLAEAAHTLFAGALASLKPEGVLVQGDAVSSLLAALAAFHLHIPVFYVEAGLRTYDFEQPFPEEGYRQMTSRLASYYFAPTAANKKNLMNEGILGKRVFVVGNTVVDSLNLIMNKLKKNGIEKLVAKNFPWLKTSTHRRLILVTIHRRENQGDTLKEILRTLIKVQRKHPDDLFVFSVHPNPKVRLQVFSMLKNNPGFILIQPSKYELFLELLSRAAAVLTDSGGIQEEAPSFGIPSLVMRKKTERTEGVKLGWSLLTGVEPQQIIQLFESLDTWKKPDGGNPYGDGKAATRIAKIIYDNI